MLLGAEDALAIEPEPDNFRLLKCNVVANDLEAKVRTVQRAISDVSGPAFLELSKTNSGDHQLRTPAQDLDDA